MTEPFQLKTARQLTCFTKYKVTAGITTRQGGYSEVPYDSLNMGLHVSDLSETVIKNRQALAEELNQPLSHWVMGEQVHGTEVKVADNSHKGQGAFVHDEAIAGVDGLITNQKDILLTAFYADCVPLLFIDSTTGWIGIAHAGWKGTVGGISRAMISKMAEQGADLNSLSMVIGPCISQKNYEVDQRVVDHIPESFRGEVLKQGSQGKFNLDLKELNRSLAIESGLAPKNIAISSYCTYEEESLFFSHRRDQGQTGRMLAFIGWTS
ncbi:peptidoglycan editing factor PgeF [Halobacillus sp. Marseille-Q1614]|uniref:peptidoglycan editing factor PgeF n=1 Tax=Halobacillus sp. Marseille-Q1614 TaxID=2709134 RepID=UPI0015710542|nr:peptidoglycan editing factor PgeF [Halobacillus sp. Marseille-Q1614]